MAARAATLAQGGSGISPATLDALIAMLNAGVHPVTPLTGSLGEAPSESAYPATSSQWRAQRSPYCGDESRRSMSFS